MAFVLLAFDDVGLGFQLEEKLRGAGYAVQWDAESAQGPSPVVAGTPPDVALIAADSLGDRLAAVAARWRALDPPPGLVALASPRTAELARRHRIHVVAANAGVDALRATIDEAARLRFTIGLSPGLARRALGLPAAADDAALLAAARTADLDLVRAALRWHAADYVWSSDEAIHALRDDRALSIPEVDYVPQLDGTLTLQTLVKRGPLDSYQAARLLWAMASTGAARFTPEPYDLATVRRRALGAARDHLRARHERLDKATYYDVLEITPDAGDDDLERAYQHLSLRFAPNKFAGLDLAAVAPLVEPLWREIEQARAALLDLPTRGRYNDRLAAHWGELRSEWAIVNVAAAEAREAFGRGQRALLAGDIYKAVGDMAAAARFHPHHPDYEVSLCWARYRAQVAGGKDRDATARSERASAEKASRGHRPWPRALLALGLLCAADGDPETARWHLHEALSVDPTLPAARQLLARLTR